MESSFRGLALHTWTVDTTPLDEALAAARSGGFEAVELRRIDFVRRPDAIEVVRASGLAVSCVGVEPGWIFSSPGDERERLFAVLDESCRNALALECSLLMSAMGPGGADLDTALQNIRRAAGIVARHGVRLAIEYQFMHPVMSSLDIVRDAVRTVGSGNVGLLLDAYHLQRGGRPGAGFDDVDGAEIFYAQYSDVPDAPPNGPPPTDRLPPGSGVVQWEGFFGLLARKGYDGYVSYEAPNPAHWSRPAADVAAEGAAATRHALKTLSGRP